MVTKTMSIKDYNKKELIDNIKNSDFLFSISTLSPEKWIRNDIGDYVTEVLRFINSGKEVKRITLIDNQGEFESKFIPLIKKGYIDYAKQYLNDAELKDRKQILRKSSAFKKLNKKLLLETLMVFGIIHSNIKENAFIVWIDKNHRNSKKEINDALEYLDEKYDELLIYSNKFCGVKYISNTEVNLVYYNETEAVTSMHGKWNELRQHIIDGNIIGISICNYLAKLDNNLSEEATRNQFLEKCQKPYNRHIDSQLTPPLEP